MIMTLGFPQPCPVFLEGNHHPATFKAKKLISLGEDDY
jgi:hypothetical protein